MQQTVCRAVRAGTQQEPAEPCAASAQQAAQWTGARLTANATNIAKSATRCMTRFYPACPPSCRVTSRRYEKLKEQKLFGAHACVP
jgi:hypothetical protein